MHHQLQVFENLQPPLRVGILGLGTVGSGTYRVLRRNQDIIVARTGRPIVVTAAAVRDLARGGCIVDTTVSLMQDPFALVRSPNVDVVVETIGGTTIAKDLVLEAVKQGKHVVTANKALLAEHGNEIFASAQRNGVIVAYEGAVAVSIPIIKTLREGLVANRIEWVAGIINGTTNLILSKMKFEGASYADALSEAQRLGYAEADPEFDVMGVDAAHKLTLLASNAFGVPLQFENVHTEGITGLEVDDIIFANSLGYCVKLLGIAKRVSAGLELRVHPTLIPNNHMLANVNGSMNAVMVKSDAAGLTMYYGAGAGSEQTASAVIADLVELCRVGSSDHRDRVPALGFRLNPLADMPVTDMSDLVTCHYLRLTVTAPTPANSLVEESLSQCGIRIRRLDVLNQVNKDGQTTLLVLTEPTKQGILRSAIGNLEALPCVTAKVVTFRLDALD